MKSFSLTRATVAATAGSSQPRATSLNQQQPLVDPATTTVSITPTDAERLVLKNNPRITASHLLALAAGQVTRETRSGELPQISAAITATKAEDGSRIGADGLSDSHLYAHAGTGGSLSQLMTDFGHTRNLVATSKLQHLPTISALAIGGITPVAPDGIFVPNWYAAAGVNLTLPLFTGFRIDAQAQEARLRQKAAERQAQDLSDSIARDVRVAALNAQTAFRRIAVAGQFRKQTAQALALAQTRYKLGLSSIVELSQAQLQSTQAAVAAVNARYDYLLALRSLDYARGQLAP